MEEIIEVFLQTLVTVLHKRQPSIKFISKYVPFTQLSDIEGVSMRQILYFNNYSDHKFVKQGRREKNLSVDFKRRLLSTGFGHAALIRNGNVYTWGNSVQGCLGK